MEDYKPKADYKTMNMTTTSDTKNNFINLVIRNYYQIRGQSELTLKFDFREVLTNPNISKMDIENLDLSPYISEITNRIKTSNSETKNKLINIITKDIKLFEMNVKEMSKKVFNPNYTTYDDIINNYSEYDDDSRQATAKYLLDLYENSIIDYMKASCVSNEEITKTFLKIISQYTSIATYSLNFIKKYYSILDFYNLAKCQNLTLEFIEENQQINWSYESLSKNMYLFKKYITWINGQIIFKYDDLLPKYPNI